MKKDGQVTESWVDPITPTGGLAVEFDRESQSLKLVRKGSATSRRGCSIALFVIAFFFVLFGLTGWQAIRNFSLSMPVVLNGSSLIAVTALMVLFFYDQQVQIDTKSKTFVSRARGILAPWWWNSTTPIGNSARFEVRIVRVPKSPVHYVLYFVPYPDVWFTFWRPTPIGTTHDPEAGKAALERLAYGLNRFLDAVRKGEPNLEQLVQPSPPGPFKP